MGKPTLSVAFSNNNLTKDIQNIDGVAGFVGTGSTSGNIGKVFTVNNIAEAESKGITAFNEPAMYRHLKEFYTEVGGNMLVYILLLADTVTMTQMLDYTNGDYAVKLLNAAANKLSYLGVFRKPVLGYNAGSEFIDADVKTAVTAAKTLCTARNSNLQFFRVLIEGRIADETSSTIYAPNTASNGFAGVVLGGTQNDLSASIGLALGRKVKYAAHIKIGKVANGALTPAKLYIGTKTLTEQNNVVIPPIAEVRATATVTITNKGTDGDSFSLRYWAGNNKVVDFPYYTKVSGDSTPTAVAAAYAALINNVTQYYGFTATSTGAVITITSPYIANGGLGASINGVNAIFQTSPSATIAGTCVAFSGGVNPKAGATTIVDTFHDAGYITFLTYPGKSGFFFGIDNMASDDDFRILVHGAVIDACAKVVAAVYIDELEGEVETNADGTITEAAAAYLEEKIKQQISTTIGDRISGFDAVVDRTINIVETSKTSIKMSVLPVGYNSYIDVELGLVASL